MIQTNWNPVVLALAAGIPAIITAVIGLANLWMQSRIHTKQADNGKTLATIETNTNSAATAAKTLELSLRAELSDLRTQFAEMKQQAALLTQAAATRFERIPMRRRLLAASLALLLPGCATLQTNGHLDIMKVLSDARWGVLAACSQQWLSPDDCVLTEDALTIADGIVANNVPLLGQAVRQALVDFERPLPPTSRVRPYLDAVIALLATG